MTKVKADATKIGYNDCMERKDALRRVLFLKGASEDAIAALTALGSEQCLQKGELLFAEHDRCMGLIVVLSGAVRIYKTDARGRDLTLGLETPGGSVLELALFDGGNYPASAEALEESRLLIVPRLRFLEVQANHPEIAAGAVWALAIRTRKLLQMLEAHALHSVQARIAAYLLETYAHKEALCLLESNETIAAHCGTAREVVSRTLRAFKDAGAIALQGRRIQITNTRLLHALKGEEGDALERDQP
jgi:CRP/FNR family transcriptional regulator